MFAGQGKLMLFGLSIGILSLIGLGFILVAPQSTDPIYNYLVGGSILVLGVGGSIGYYAYNWTIVYTKYRSIGMLLRPGWGKPSGEIWVLNKPVIELIKDVEEAGKENNAESTDKEDKSQSPQIVKKTSEVDIEKIDQMIPDKAKASIIKNNGKFHYYLVEHGGDIEGRDILVTVNALEGMFEYFPEEVMINDFPRRVNISFGTGSLIGQHDVFITPIQPTGLKRITELLSFKKEPKLYDSTRVWLVIDSNLHGWKVRYDLGLETPDKDKLVTALSMIKTLDAKDYVEENALLRAKIIDLKQKLLQKLSWDARYSEKNIYQGSEDSLEEKMRNRDKSFFWNWKNILLIIVGSILLLALVYFLFYNGVPVDTINPNGNSTIPIKGGS